MSTKPTPITAAAFAVRFPNAKLFEIPSAERPVIEVHKATGQIYPRTRANYERTRRMAARMGPAALRRLEQAYDVFELAEVQGAHSVLSPSSIERWLSAPIDKGDKQS